MCVLLECACVFFLFGKTHVFTYRYSVLFGIDYSSCPCLSSLSLFNPLKNGAHTQDPFFSLTLWIYFCVCIERTENRTIPSMAVSITMYINGKWKRRQCFLSLISLQFLMNIDFVP